MDKGTSPVLPQQGCSHRSGDLQTAPSCKDSANGFGWREGSPEELNQQSPQVLEWSKELGGVLSLAPPSLAERKLHICRAAKGRLIAGRAKGRQSEPFTLPSRGTRVLSVGGPSDPRRGCHLFPQAGLLRLFEQGCQVTGGKINQATLHLYCQGLLHSNQQGDFS